MIIARYSTNDTAANATTSVTGSQRIGITPQAEIVLTRMDNDGATGEW